MIERSYTRQDSSYQCRHPEKLANAEKIAQKEKLGMWQDFR